MNKEDEDILEDLDKDSKQMELLKDIDKKTSVIFWIVVALGIYNALKMLMILSVCIINM